MRKTTFRKLYQFYRLWIHHSKYNECRWIRFNYIYDYETDCSNYFEAIPHQSIKQMSFKYCPFCGKEIVEEIIST